MEFKTAERVVLHEQLVEACGRIRKAVRELRENE